MSKRDERRIASACEYVRKHLSLDIHFKFDTRGDDAIVAITRENPNDSRAFLVTYSIQHSRPRTMGQLRCDAFHEMLHAMSQPLYDIVEDKILMAVPVEKRGELRKKYYAVREDVIRHMERRLGPKVFPRLPWEKV